MRASLLGVALLATSCYVPDPPAGAPCDTDESCPADQRCVARRCTGDDGDPLVSPSCQSADRCTAAARLGAVSGDTASQALMATGHTAAWFRVRVTEDDDTLGRPLRVAALLTLPAAVAFDVFVYVNVQTEAIECAASVGTPLATDDVKLVRASWGEGMIPNGRDDDRDVSIEVRPVAGACAEDQPWQLVVQGNGT